jgi:hypothetical protein
MRPGRRGPRWRAQVAAVDLDIAVVGQLPVAQLPFGDKLEPGPLEVVRCKAALGRYCAVDKAPEDLARNTNDPLVFADADAKFNGLPVGIPAGVLGEAEEHDAPPTRIARCSYIVPILNAMTSV